LLNVFALDDEIRGWGDIALQWAVEVDGVAIAAGDAVLDGIHAGLVGAGVVGCAGGVGLELDALLVRADEGDGILVGGDGDAE
jgi:hypothetical protein